LLSDGATQTETFGDAVIRPSGDWGRSHGQTVELLPNGQATRTLSHYLYGYKFFNRLRTPTKIDVTVPAGGGAVVVRVGKVSDVGVLRILVDGEPKADFPFSALPGSPGQQTTERRPPEADKPGPHEVIYQAVFNKDCEVALPAGRHTVELANLGNDWLWLDSVTFRRCKSSRYAELQVLALRDAGSGEVIAWMRDAESNWRNDRDRIEPRTIPASRLSIPLNGAADAEYALEWWDTRRGEVVARDRTRSTGGQLNVQIPPVRRDVALRATRAIAQATR